MKITEPYLYFWARLVVRICKPFIIGITGSVGKTTTTARIASVLTHKDAKQFIGRVGYTTDNMNNNIGLPATLLLYNNWAEIPDNRLGKLLLMSIVPFRALKLILGNYPQIMVLEFATGWRGNMQHLVNLVAPDIAIVTKIGAAHLERFKTLEGIAKEKSILVQAVPSSGLVILGEEHDYVEYFEQKSTAPVIKVAGKGIKVSENITRVLCRHLSIPDELIDSGLKEFDSPKGRLNQMDLAEMTILDDSYNANPLSVNLGLDVLASIAKPGQRRIAILGVMAELGEESCRYHEEVGNYARSRANLLIGIGSLAKYYKPDIWFNNNHACLNEVENLLQQGDCILVKGSASSRMDQVVEKLLEVSTKREINNN